MIEAESLLRNLILPLIEHPDDLRIESEAQEDATLLRVHLHDEDIGRVIGRQGRRAEALRSILKAKGNTLGERLYIDICDGSESKKSSVDFNTEDEGSHRNAEISFSDEQHFTEE